MLAVRSLYSLTKFMMATPCWPSAGPIGGAGVALPAGICNFTYARIRLAIDPFLPARCGPARRPAPGLAAAAIGAAVTLRVPPGESRARPGSHVRKTTPAPESCLVPG